MRGLLIVNRHATSMTATVTDLAVRSLAGLVDLDVERTQYRGHARELAAAAGRRPRHRARRGRLDQRGRQRGHGRGEGPVDLAGARRLGGGAGPTWPPEAAGPTWPPGPLIAVIPGGGANVLARALGVPLDAAAAIRQVREAIAAGRHRTIGLGLAADRYFTFSAGLGWDAEVVREVDRMRARGHRESVTLFLRTMIRQYYRGTDRRSRP